MGCIPRRQEPRAGFFASPLNNIPKEVLTLLLLPIQNESLDKELWSFDVEIEVRPGSKKSLIKKNSEGKIKIYLNVPPVDGKANSELIAVLSELFDTPKSLIEIKSGLKSKTKKIKIFYRISKKFTVTYYVAKINQWYTALKDS